MTDVTFGRTLYDVFGVEPNAPIEKIRAVYRLRSQEAHPDRDDGSGERQRLLNDAYGILKDPEKRREYNEQMGLSLKPRSLKPGRAAYQEIEISRQDATRPISYTFNRWEPCSRCWGQGCTYCQGGGKILETVTLTVTIPADVSHHLVESQGRMIEPGGSRGDLVLYVVWKEE